MKRIISWSALVFLCLTFGFVMPKRDLTANQEIFDNSSNYVPNELLVKFKDDSEAFNIRQELNIIQPKIITYLGTQIDVPEWNAEVIQRRSFPLNSNLFHLKVPEGIGTEWALQAIKLSPNVEYAQRNYIYHFCDIKGKTLRDEEDYFDLLWGLNNMGQTGGTSDADIDAPEAWDIFTGSSNTIVAVIDSGVDLDHKDLEDNIWINPGESGGGKENNNVDDDYNGYIDDYRGWDFGEGDNNPSDTVYNSYHGTHVAGIIAANGENGHGVLGVAPNVKLMVIKISNSNGGISTSSIVNAIQYSIINHANISNNSYGIGSYDQTLYNVIAQAKNAGQLYICAAGNDNLDIDTSPRYPACFNLDNIVTVVSSDHNDVRSAFSNYGENSADVAAPGGSGYPTYGSSEEEDIYSTQPGDMYGY